MGEWTNLNIQDGVEYSTSKDPFGRVYVKISTIHGEFEEEVGVLRRKLANHNLLPDVRKMFKSMLDYVENDHQT